MTSVSVCVMCRVRPSTNAREHWARRARRVKEERARTSMVLRSRLGAYPQLPVRVTLTRCYPQGSGCRPYDDDNLASALKPIRDEVAAWMDVDDAPGHPVEWVCAQERGERDRPHYVRIEIAEVRR